MYSESSASHDVICCRKGNFRIKQHKSTTTKLHGAKSEPYIGSAIQLQRSPLNSGSVNSEILLIQTDEDGPCGAHCIRTG